MDIRSCDRVFDFIWIGPLKQAIAKIPPSLSLYKHLK